jgi:hypothetical protein
MWFWLWPHPMQHYIYRGCPSHGIQRFPCETLDLDKTLTPIDHFGCCYGSKCRCCGVCMTTTMTTSTAMSGQCYWRPEEIRSTRRSSSMPASSRHRTSLPLIGSISDDMHMSPPLLRWSSLGLLDLEVLGSNYLY